MFHDALDIMGKFSIIAAVQPNVRFCSVLFSLWDFAF